MRKIRNINKKRGGTEETFEQRMQEFGEEVEHIGKRIEARGKGMKGWFHRTFGIIGPFISTVFGMLCLAIIIFLINWMHALTGIPEHKWD